MEKDNVTIGLTSDDWELTAGTKYFAQRGEDGAFDFGGTEQEALANLLARERRRQDK